MRSADIARPDGGSEPIGRVVTLEHGVVFVLERNRCRDGAEISSRAILISLFTSTKTVGLTKYSFPSSAPPPHLPSCRLRYSPSRSNCSRETSGSNLVFESGFDLGANHRRQREKRTNPVKAAVEVNSREKIGDREQQDDSRGNCIGRHLAPVRAA